MIRSLAALIIILCVTSTLHAAGTVFAVAVTDTPVLNTPDFKSVFGGKDGRTLRKDRCGQLRSLEFVALPGTVFTVEEEIWKSGRKIYRVTTSDYPYPATGGYYVDAGFTRIQQDRPAERKALLPTKEEIIASLKKMNNSRYVWGGNSSHGIAGTVQQYPPAGGGALSSADADLWRVRGVDCSGLLYEATGGYTPRNTSALVSFGRSVSIAGRSLKEIAAVLMPLDLIVWPGHVLIVIDGNNVIESRLACEEPEKGVRISTLDSALAGVMSRRKPVDSLKNSGKEFVVRRWY